jgi:predicted MPP superfamily phosphohydrolase
MVLYTNRGLGMLKPHLRLNCRPEITILTLLAPL